MHSAGEGFPSESLVDGIVESLRVKQQPVGVITGQNLHNGLGDLIHLIGVHKNAESATVQGVHRTVLIAGDDRLSAGHGLQKNNAKTLLLTGHHKDITKLVVRTEFLIGDEASENDQVTDAEFLRMLFQCLSVSAGAANQIADLREAFSDRLKRSKDFKMTFVTFTGIKAADGQKDGLFGAQVKA